MLTSCSIDIYKPIHVQCVIYLGKIPPHFYGIAKEVRIIPSPESLLGNLRAEDRMTKMISVLAIWVPLGNETTVLCGWDNKAAGHILALHEELRCLRGGGLCKMLRSSRYIFMYAHTQTMLMLTPALLVSNFLSFSDVLSTKITSYINNWKLQSPFTSSETTHCQHPSQRHGLSPSLPFSWLRLKAIIILPSLAVILLLTPPCEALDVPTLDFFSLFPQNIQVNINLTPSP